MISEKKGTAAVQEAISEMPKDDQELAQAIHEIVANVAPDLYPKTWYGMPDEGSMWPTSFALKKMTQSNEKNIRSLVKSAI